MTLTTPRPTTQPRAGVLTFAPRRRLPRPSAATWRARAAWAVLILAMAGLGGLTGLVAR